MGDKLLAIDDFDITPTTGPDEVRNHLRGDPGTPVTVKFLREGVGGQVNEPQTITMDRTVVRIPDVKYFGKFRSRQVKNYFLCALSLVCNACAIIVSCEINLCCLHFQVSLVTLRMALATSILVVLPMMQDARYDLPFEHCSMVPS